MGAMRQVVNDSLPFDMRSDLCGHVMRVIALGFRMLCAAPMI